ncbi:hypothetical protein [Ohessyouella blattaphilus]|uniref:Interferon-induced transmembrane protein n=1 Tax=Ohessyouella blattaphilus TaxID=2949333 RepID=A0ABT1EF27_9FIRM|nr:hypothetical protein [Ohessyouella blattaphilus]MCP1109293.1 hypothetical protein [Ohessyouella blattaphilus]MCR8562687.1 hypothetical protein [Ohessyouella blattaphilus]
MENNENNGMNNENQDQYNVYNDPNANVTPEATPEAAPAPEVTPEPQPQQQYQQQYQQQQYQQPYQQQYQQQPTFDKDANLDKSPMEMKDWLLTLIVLMVPCVGIVMYFVWAFSSTGNINRRNFCRAGLVMSAIALILYILFIAIFGAAIFAGIGSYGY